MDISIIIPSFNGKQLLEQSLPLLSHVLASKISCEVIVVDNGSKDPTLPKGFDGASNSTNQYIKLDKNYGFTRAVNEGVRRAKGAYILILNDDCFVEKDTIQKLYSYLKKSKKLIATQPIIQTPKGAVENIGYVVDLTKGKAKIVTNKGSLPAGRQASTHAQNDNMWKAGNVYGLSATCLMIRKDVFESIGMLDESFHSYLEDVDLFIRLATKGYKYAPCLEVSARHLHMGTSKNMGVYKQQHDLLNWINIIMKNYPRSFILRHGFSLAVERLRNLSGLIKAYLS